MRQKCILALVVTVFLISLSPLSAADDTVIRRGIDIFSTPANGNTFYDFAKNPIPAGFFCENSAAFTGRVAMRGLPIETQTPGQLRGADTIVERLDDATFGRDGVATTRIRMRALSLVSISPIRTSCGAFHVYVRLADRQRVTTMRIDRTNPRGGTFSAPVAVDALLSFVPVKGRSPRKLELAGNFNLPQIDIPWSVEGGPGMKRVASSVVVDTNGDMKPDTRLAGTSNFAPGWSPDNINRAVGSSCYMCEPPICHEDQSCAHCTGGIYACNGQVCP